jgi:IS30 family transposase
VPQPYRQLNLDERRRLFRRVDARVPIAKIATRLGRHRSTIYREIRRNRIQLEPWLRRYRFHEHGYVEGYFPVTAQDLVRERRQRLSKLRPVPAPGRPHRPSLAGLPGRQLQDHHLRPRLAAYPLLASQVGAEAYFCDPHAPWQKGNVENTNGRLRRF